MDNSSQPLEETRLRRQISEQHSLSTIQVDPLTSVDNESAIEEEVTMGKARLSDDEESTAPLMSHNRHAARRMSHLSIDEEDLHEASYCLEMDKGTHLNYIRLDNNNNKKASYF
jgi:hypothetical protein